MNAPGSGGAQQVFDAASVSGAAFQVTVSAVDRVSKTIRGSFQVRGTTASGLSVNVQGTFDMDLYVF